MESNLTGYNMEKSMKCKRFFNAARTSLDSLLSTLEDDVINEANIRSLITCFEDSRHKYKSSTSVGNTAHPLIVLEGLDGSGKSTVGKRLAKRINGIQMSTPPKSISHLRKVFDGNYYLHAPYYYLGNYAAAMEVSQILQSHPVVMDRYWHSTTAFALAQMKENYFKYDKTFEIPEKGNAVFDWPDDLLKPDVVLLLSVSENVRNQRLSRRKSITIQENLLTSSESFRNDVLKAYGNMSICGVQMVDGNKEFDNVLQQINDKIEHLF